MTESFTASAPGALAKSTTARRRVLVTGAAGNIGAYFAEHSHEKYDLRRMVHKLDERADALRAFGEVVAGDLGDLEKMKQLCRDVDTVVHLAGDPSPDAAWSSLLESNIVGAYHTFVAAKAAGCRRLIYASSIHAVSGYPADVQVKTSEPVNPGDLYGVTKCFGEALGRYMAEKEGLSVIALRIGAFQPLEVARQEGSISMLDAFVSQRDLNQLIERCIDVENITFAILQGGRAAPGALLHQQVRAGRPLRRHARRAGARQHRRHHYLPRADAHRLASERAVQRPARSGVHLVLDPGLAAAQPDRCAAGGRRGRSSRPAGAAIRSW